MAAGLSRSDVVDSLYNSWTARLSLLAKIPASKAADLTKAFSGDDQPWTPDQRASLAQAIFDKQTGTKKGAVLAMAHPRNPMQTCIHFENFITEDEWAKLRTHTLESSSMALLATRASQINLREASEPTLFRIVAIFCFCHKKEHVSQEEAVTIKQNLQKHLKLAPHTKMEGSARIVHYPFAADGLPPDLILRAYPNGVPPVVVIPELDTILGTNKMRTSKSAPSWLSHVPSHLQHLWHSNPKKEVSFVAKPERSLEPSPPELPCAHLPLTASKINAHASCAALDIPGRPRLFRPRYGVVSSPPRAAKVKVETIEDSPATTKDSVDHMEQALIAAVAARTGAKKRPVACDAADALKVLAASAAAVPPTQGIPMAVAAAVPPKKPLTMKATKAIKVKAMKVKAMKVKAGAGPMKKPAAALDMTMSDVFAELQKRKSSMTRGAFTTMAFKRAEVRMRQKGGSPEDAKIFARKMYAKAAELWNN